MDYTQVTPLGARVLVVDDEPEVARQVATAVTQMGHYPTIVNTWTEALRAFSDDEIDLVLMDAVMPTVDGFKLILFLTGLADRQARVQGIAAGADDFLCKPVDPLELQVRLTAMLRIRWLTRDLEAKTRALTRLALVDALTGVGNRRAFDDRLRGELEAARRRRAPLSLLMLDIDHFKHINDTHGHAAGDRLLAMFGRLLQEVTRACDAVFRYGGEEFAILASDTPAGQAVHLAERVLGAFALRSREATKCGPQTVSVGICGTDQLPANAGAAALIEAADAALYRAKADGRNCLMIHESTRDAA
jgi:diguanylate cyclase (GGDEF)-like protein